MFLKERKILLFLTSKKQQLIMKKDRIVFNDWFVPEVQLFMKERIVISSSGKIRTRDVYDAFKLWCIEKELEPITNIRFALIMRFLGHPSTKTRQTWYFGIDIKHSHPSGDDISKSIDEKSSIDSISTLVDGLTLDC